MTFTRVNVPKPLSRGWPRQSPAEMNAFYGDPDANRNGKPDPDWEAANIVKLPVPYPLFHPSTHADGSIKDKRGIRLATLRVHRRCADSLARALAEIPRRFNPEQIARFDLDNCGGVHNFRVKRAGASLSIHSWGAAIDLSHLINHFKRRYDPEAGMMPIEVVAIFADEGWTWGGLWSTADGMHFQAADL